MPLTTRPLTMEEIDKFLAAAPMTDETNAMLNSIHKAFVDACALGIGYWSMPAPKDRDVAE